MDKQYIFSAGLQIASVLTKSDWTNVNVHTLLQSKDRKQPSINAYLGARYSRSGDSITDIASEITEKGIDPASKLEAIFQGYGHKSVGDMAELFLCIENVPMITAMRAFNMNPVLSGQERSTRYQDFNSPNYTKIPQELKVSKQLREKYDAIISEHLTNYRELLQPTEDAFAKHFIIDKDDKRQLSALKARTFDTVRYFLPLGLNTSLGFVMSARNWSEYISRLSGSDNRIENHLASTILDLLQGNEALEKLGYIPEADGLIRHTQPNRSRVDSTTEVQQLLARFLPKITKAVGSTAKESFAIGKASDPIDTLVKHYLLSINPNISVENIKLNKTMREQLGQILMKFHNHNDQIGNVAQMGAYVIDGYADHGILKDLNRHRSFERYIPMWEQYTSIEQEFNRTSAQYYYLCDYLFIDEFADLLWSYQTKISSTYDKIIDWYELAQKEQEKSFVEEYTRYLLPHAHATRYRFYGSVDDMQYLCNLRTRPGGHIAYRSLTYNWLEKLAKTDPFWTSLVEKLPAVKADSREQFIDRG